MQRPACGQCLQRGSTCPGYGAGLTFVHDSRCVSSKERDPLVEQGRSLSVVSTPPSLIRSATQAGFSDHFWYIYLPRKHVSPGSHHGSLDEFFQAVENISSHEIASKHAFWALSSSIIGREVSNTQLLLLSSRMYGQALTELRAKVKKMRNSSLSSSAEMALTCNLLALYEVSSLCSLALKRNILTSCSFSTIPTRSALASLPIAKGLQNWCGSEGQVDFAPTSRGQLSRAFEWPSSSPPSSVDGLLSSLQRSGAQSPGI